MASQSVTPDPFDAIALEFIEALRCGERPTAQQFASQHPEYADRIRELFPTILAMESLRDVKAESAEVESLEFELKRLGDLRIIREIGRGGMGIVYEAVQESLDRRVAVKVLPAQMLLDAKRLARFKREAKTAAKLHHTNIVPVLGVGEHDGYHFYLMQLIDGVGLDHAVNTLINPADTTVGQNTLPAETKDEGSADSVSDFEIKVRSNPTNTDLKRLPSIQQLRDPIKVAQLGWQAASALQYAHGQGVLHRDIKPANLILDSSDVLWIADFGLSKGIGVEEVTQTGDVLGTIRYMAPEQFIGQADARSDIYSLGLTIYELLTKRPAHDEQLRRKSFVSGDPAPQPARPCEIDASIPRDLETVVLKAIALEPIDRYQTAGDLAEDLRCIVEDRPIMARRASPVHRLRRWCRRNRALSASLFVAATAVLMVAVISTLKYHSTKELNEQVSSALASTKVALADEKTARQKADATSEIAWNALDEIFARFAPRRVDPGEIPAGSDGTGLSVKPALSAEAAGLLGQLLESYNALAAEGDSSAAYQQRIAEAHRRVGDIYQRLGKHDLALSEYKQAIEIFEHVQSHAEESGDAIESQLAIAAITNDIANIYRQRGDRDTEVTYRRDALGQLAELVHNDQREQIQLLYELARTLYLHGRLEREVSGKPVQGGRIKHRLHWPADHQLPQSADSDLWSAGLNSTIALHAAIELLQPLEQSPQCRYLLARCYQDAASGGARRIDADAMLKAEATLQQLVDEFPHVTDYRFALCLTWTAKEPRPADRKSAGLAAVKTRLQKALDYSQKLVQQHPNEPAYQLLRARAALRLANVPMQPRNIVESRKKFEEAIRLHDTLASTFPDSVPSQIAQANCRINFARYLNRIGNKSDARSLLNESVQLLDNLRRQGIPEQLTIKPLAEATRQIELANAKSTLEN